MQNRSTHGPLILAALAIAASLPILEAHADEHDEWDITLGVGAASIPKYPGSDEQKARLLPVVSVRYGRFFVGGDSDGVGVNLIEDEHWRAGVIASFGAFKPRKESDDLRLHGLGDIDSTPRLGSFVSYTQSWLTASAAVSSDVGGNRQGTLATLSLAARWQATPQLLLTAGPSITWANGQYMQTFFGIDEEQALHSGLPQYRPGGGVANIGLRVGANYRFNQHWGFGVSASTAQLQGDAKDSPITQDKTQSTIVAFAAYHF